jgi:hypothetical protein
VKKAAVMLLMLVCMNSAYSEDRDSTYKYWLTLGFWADRDVSSTLNYSFSLGDDFFTVGYFDRSGMLGGLASDGFHFKAVNASIGERVQSTWFHISGFIGPSYVFGRKLISGGSQESFNTFGIDLQTQLMFRPANEVGIGLALYGNLNLVRNYSGFRFMLTFGNGK